MKTCSPASSLNHAHTLSGVSATGYQVHHVEGAFIFLSESPFCGRVNAAASSFCPSPYLCVSILHVLIACRPFTLTVSNGIACRGHGPRSRSCKCTTHVCANSPIDALLAPMSWRIEPSARLFLSGPYLDSLKVLEIQLRPTTRERRASIFNRTLFCFGLFLKSIPFRCLVYIFA